VDRKISAVLAATKLIGVIVAMLLATGSLLFCGLCSLLFLAAFFLTGDFNFLEPAVGLGVAAAITIYLGKRFGL